MRKELHDAGRNQPRAATGEERQCQAGNEKEDSVRQGRHPHRVRTHKDERSDFSFAARVRIHSPKPMRNPTQMAHRKGTRQSTAAAGESLRREKAETIQDHVMAPGAVWFVFR